MKFTYLNVENSKINIHKFQEIKITIQMSKLLNRPSKISNSNINNSKIKI